MIELLRKLRDALARRRLSDELREELRFHQGELARDARAAGMNIADADAAASRRLGNATAILEDARSMWTLHWLDNLGQDIRYGLRALRRNPGFTVVAALTLALGIGATTAIFTIVNGVILRPLPYKDADRLVIVWERMPDAPQIMVSYPNFLDWRSRVHAFEGAAIYNPFNQFTLTNLGDAARVNGGYASGNFFDVYGVRAARGRLFEARDDRVGADPVAVVTNSFWLRRLGADSLAVGKPLTLDGVTYTVVGVLAPGIQPSGVDVWIPIGLFANSDRFAPRSNHPGTIVLGRLKPGMTLSDMQRDLDGVYAQLRADHGENAGISASGTWISEIILGDVRRPLYIFAGAVGLVLLIACANVASLLLGRAASRSREIALRLAIGARRGRIVRQLLTESVLLSVVGGVLGALLAYGAVRVFVGLRPPSVPRLAEIHVDTHVMLFAAGISVVTGIIFGLVPALQTVQGDLFRSLRDGARGATAGRQRLRLRSALMLGEVMLALVLLVGAGLLARSFQKLANVDVGIDARNLVAGYVSLPPKTYPDSVKRVQFFEALLEKARTIPGVTEVALGGDLPPGTSWQTGVTFMSLPPVQPGKEPLLNAMVASPAWFETVKMRVISGRAFTDADVAGGVRVAIISENVARKFFGAKNPLGELVKRGRASSTGTPATIIGVVNEVRNDGLRVTSKGTIYFPLA
ncbi:MAG TPA: ABC transporter permease, partial [Gemmatimonadaceae bacterium]|nr:ABC transporter permease [Gemmatimonadaceae bacterium]